MFIYNILNINEYSLRYNGEELFLCETNESASEKLRQLYRFLNIAYPKFFKMDNLSKLAFLGAELLLNTFDTSSLKEDELATVFYNRSSSLDTDFKHQESIHDKSNYFPHPAVFVYTLPNIANGEVAIRHGLKGENYFFISSQNNWTEQIDFCEMLLETSPAKVCLLAWVEILGEKYEMKAICLGKEIAEDSSKNANFAITLKPLLNFSKEEFLKTFR